MEDLVSPTSRPITSLADGGIQMRFLEDSKSAKPFYSGHNTCLSASNPGTEFNLQNDSRGHKKQFLIIVA